MRHVGNGNTDFKLQVQEVGEGYVIFSPENLLDVPEQAMRSGDVALLNTATQRRGYSSPYL